MQRNVICADAMQWLDTCPTLDAVITSLPDMEEVGLSPEEWEHFFLGAVKKIFAKLDHNGYAIFYQTDRKHQGQLTDKSYLVTLAAKNSGAKQVFHKIVLKQEPNTVNLFRPSFTHLLGYSFNGYSGRATPDVFAAGEMVYKNAMGLEACKAAVTFIKANSQAKTIYDPFCGQGSVLAVANAMGLDAVGVEILPEQVKKASTLNIKI